MSSQAPLRVPQHDRRGDARLHVLVCNINLSAGTPSSIDYQYTSMPTGAKKGSPDHVRTRRALRGCRQPGEEAGGRAGRRRAAPRQGPASHPLPGACRGGGATPVPPRPPSLADGAPSSHIHVGGGTVKIEGADTAPSCRPSNPHMGRGARPGRKFHAMVAVPKNG